MPDLALTPNVAPRPDRNSEQAIASIAVLLKQMESGLARISTVAETCNDRETRRTLRAQSLALSDLIAQARQKAAMIIQPGRGRPVADAGR